MTGPTGTGSAPKGVQIVRRASQTVERSVKT